MAALERENALIKKVDFKKIFHFAEKVKVVAQTVLSDNSKEDWTIIDAEELTPKRLQDFISRRRYG